MTAITVQDLVVSRGETKVLQGISFSVEPGFKTSNELPLPK